MPATIPAAGYFTLTNTGTITAEPGNGAPNTTDFQAFWGRWLSEGLNGVNYFEKPPLVYWATAISEGQLPPWTNVTSLLDVIEGPIRMHVFAPAPNDGVRSDMATYTEHLVDEQLLLLAHVGPMRGYDGAWTPPASGS